MTRREALLLTSTAISAQRLPPVEDLANTLEMEAMAQRKLPPDVFRQIADSQRAAFDRITFRPRMMVNTLGLDLTTELFGQRHFAPILVGPISLQGRFHAGAELEMGKGAEAARAAVVTASETTIPLGQLKPGWWQYRPQAPIPPSATALILTAPFAEADIPRLRKLSSLPVLVKGVMTAADAAQAIRSGASGLIVSSYRTQAAEGLAAPIDALPAVAAEVGNKVPILIDGGFRRGGDVLKALALGATAVLIGRPAVWGLAAYGARGVQQVLEQLQTELARDMAMCGIRTCREASLRHVRIHRR